MRRTIRPRGVTEDECETSPLDTRFLSAGATLGLVGTMTGKMQLPLSDGDTQGGCDEKKELLSHRETWNTALCDNMDGPRISHLVTRSEKAKNLVISVTCGT